MKMVSEELLTMWAYFLSGLAAINNVLLVLIIIWVGVPGVNVLNPATPVSFTFRAPSTDVSGAPDVSEIFTVPPDALLVILDIHAISNMYKV